jgi:hypothetical protein
LDVDWLGAGPMSGDALACASRVKHALASGSLAEPAGRNLRATERLSFVSPAP